MEGPAPRVRQLKKRPQAFHPLGQSGIWQNIFQVLMEDPDNRYLTIDSIIVQAYQQAACGKGGAR